MIIHRNTNLSRHAYLVIMSLVVLNLLTTCTTKSGVTPAPAVTPAENPVSQYLTDEPNLFVLVSNSNIGDYGLVFSPLLNGTVTRLGCRLPEADQYRVTLWDADAKTVLKQVVVDQTTAKASTYRDVDAVKLMAQKRYIISVNMFSPTVSKRPPFYAWKGGDAVLPFTKGSIRFTDACSVDGTLTVFPTISTSKVGFYGFSDFTFVPD